MLRGRREEGAARERVHRLEQRADVVVAARRRLSDRQRVLERCGEDLVVPGGEQTRDDPVGERRDTRGDVRELLVRPLGDASAWSNRSGDSGDREALIERETSNT